jgi:hypothetical protein
MLDSTLSLRNLRARWVARRARIRETEAALARADQAFGPSRLDRLDRLDPFGPTPAQVNRISDAMAGIPSQYRHRSLQPLTLVNPADDVMS